MAKQHIIETLGESELLLPGLVGEGARRAKIGQRSFREGKELCLDAESGPVLAGSPAVEEQRPTEEPAAVAAWRKQPEQAGRG